MKTEELRLLQTLQGLRQSLNDITVAHNNLFQSTGEHINASDVKFAIIDDVLDTLKDQVQSLQFVRSVHREKIKTLDERAEGISARLTLVEQDVKDAIADIKRIEKELSDYQANCGRTITEILMRLDVLEGHNARNIKHVQHPSDQK